jgi:hypothetical protein
LQPPQKIKASCFTANCFELMPSHPSISTPTSSIFSFSGNLENLPAQTSFPLS